MSEDSAFAKIRKQVQDLAASGREYNKKIQAARGLERHFLRLEKARIGRETRLLLLTFAMFRSVPYRKLETRCKEDGSPILRTYLISNLLGIAVKNCPEGLPGVSKESIMAWISATAIMAEEAA